MTNSKIFKRFIKFGQVADQQGRKKIVDIIKKWQPVLAEFSNISPRYLSTINSFITDTAINNILKIQPNAKEELIQQLFQLLENIDKGVVEYQAQDTLRGVYEDFSKISEKEFISFSKSGKTSKYKKHLLNNYKKEEISISKVKIDLQDLVQEENDRKKAIKHDIQELEIYLKEVEGNLSTVQQSINELNSTNRKGLKIKGKIDIKTGKPIPYINPNEEKIKKLTKELSDFEDEKVEIKGQLQLERKKLTIKGNSFQELQKDFTENWRVQLELKEMQRILAIIDKARAAFLKKLYKQIEELKKMLELLKPFLAETNDFGRLWNMSKGNWKNINFKLLKQYAKLLEKDNKIQELADLLGRYRRAEAVMEQETFNNIQVISNYKIQHSGKAELVGINQSDDLNNLLPTELALFSDLQTESIFFKRFAEKKLQTFKYTDKSLDFTSKTTKEQREKQTEKDKGPFILAIDTSGSMHGTPEQLAKIIAFAITKIGMKDRRKVFLITFSTDIRTFDLSEAYHSLPKLIEFLQMSFNGGTDASDAVKAAVQQMKSEAYEKSDLLIVSDGVFGALSSNILKTITALQEVGNRFNALMIGNSYNKNALSFCDNVWQYQASRNNLGQLVDLIKLSLQPRN